MSQKNDKPVGLILVSIGIRGVGCKQNFGVDEDGVTTTLLP
jgi:hypothetical protein